MASTLPDEEARLLLLDRADELGPRNLARCLGINAQELKAYLNGKESLPPHLTLVLHALSEADLPKPRRTFSFIDLFAGIGGTRMGFELAGGECVFTSERDQSATETYKVNFRDSHHEIAGDITEVPESSIPHHDVLVAGFPCQPFSLAGVSKKNSLGRKHGFEDETQGTLFFDVARILKEKQPSAFMLENVKNLRSHDHGKTFAVIIRTLTELGYYVQTRVIDAYGWVPQHRERIFIVGFKDGSKIDWEYPPLLPEGSIPTRPSADALNLHTITAPDSPIKVADILHSEENSLEMLHDNGRFAHPSTGRALDRYTLSDHLWQYLQDYKAKHAAKGNGFGFGLVTRNQASTRTLSARYHKDGSEILINQEGKNPRRLTPREAARLMGFDDSFIIPVSDTQAYRQFGNSVVVPLIETIAKQISSRL